MIGFDNLAAIAQIAISIIVGVATCHWWMLERRKFKEEPAIRALENFFSAELSHARYKLFDYITFSLMATSQPDAGKLDIYRKVFCIDKDSTTLKSRYEFIQLWRRKNDFDEDAQKIMDDFLNLSGLMQVSIQSIFNAAEYSPQSARLIQSNMGRLLVWWMLVWPGAFDHTGRFLGERFVKDCKVGDYNPGDEESDAYTKLFRKHPLWNRADWQGAKENYETLNNQKLKVVS